MLTVSEVQTSSYSVKLCSCYLNKWLFRQREFIFLSILFIAEIRRLSRNGIWMLFGHLARVDEAADVRRIFTTVPPRDWKRPAERPHACCLTTMKNNLSSHNLLPLCGRCHRTGTGQALLEVIGSKRSSTLKWCKLNNDDDDDDTTTKYLYMLISLNFI